MHISVAADKCPHCSQSLDVHFFSLTSLLGTPSMICRWCRAEVASGRVEWRDMSRAAKGWFLGVSLAYVGIVGFLGGYSFLFTQACWLREPARVQGVPDFTGTDFLTGFILWGAAVVLFQGARLVASVRRSRKLPYEPAQGFWNLQTWVQLKCLLLLFLVPALAWVTRQLVDLIGG